MMTPCISGWDIGGAHIKLARSTMAGQIIDVRQYSCPLWQGLTQLEQTITTILGQLNNQADTMAITMTGELVDIFPDRKAGVAAILTCLSQFIEPEQMQIYAGEHGWLSMDEAMVHWQAVASRNWHASASLVAHNCQQGILVDLGSTTCDIIAFEPDRAVTPKGQTDFERQRSRELLYTGAIRTPLIAISKHAPFNGQSITLAAEVFATMADVWCLLGELDPSLIQDTSADGLPFTPSHCARRLARMLGTDFDTATMTQWQQFAAWFAEQQCHQICEAILHVHSAYPALPLDAPLIGAGVGRFVVKQCAQRLQRPYLDFAECIAASHPQAASHAPAVAMALLAASHLP